MSEIIFVNKHPYPCGCKISFSDGKGEYSDVIYVDFCEKHSPKTLPEADAKIAGYYRSGSGKWIKKLIN